MTRHQKQAIKMWQSKRYTNHLPSVETPKDSLQLTFTGKMSVLVDLEQYGPIQYRVDDLNTTLAVTTLLLEAMNNVTSVDAYSASEQNTFTQMLDF